MIVLQKNRILLVISLVFISVFAYMFQIGRTTNSVQTVSLPVSNKVVVLDAGHGIPDGGDEMLKLRE